MTQATVSIGIPVWNGEAFLAEALDSLLAQDYEDLELILLDNLSTDRTRVICEAYAQRDCRVRYVLDDARRDVIQGHKKVAQLATGEFFMVACDDDWYAPEYVSTLMRLMAANPAVGLAYSGWDWIYPDGSTKPSGCKRFWKPNNSQFHNFAHYLLSRTPIPFAFGLVRTELHRDALNYFYRPDHRGWNHDNLYMLRLLSLARVDSAKDTLFYYRQRDRDALYRLRGQSHNPGGAFTRYFRGVLHQISVTRAVAKIIEASSFTLIQKRLLKAYSILVFFFLSSRCSLVLRPVYRALRGKRS